MDRIHIITTSSRNLILHNNLPKCVASRLILPSSCRPRPNFSFSAYLCEPRWKLGKLHDSFLAFLEKNPLFLVEKEGYPFTSSLLDFAEAQVTLLPFGPPLALNERSPPYALLGLDLPLTVSKGVARPGLAPPPPRFGEGDRDKDMSALGVPGIGGNG